MPSESLSDSGRVLIVCRGYASPAGSSTVRNDLHLQVHLALSIRDSELSSTAMTATVTIATDNVRRTKTRPSFETRRRAGLWLICENMGRAEDLSL